VTGLQSLQTVINHVFLLCVAMCFYVFLPNQAKGNKAHFRLTAKQPPSPACSPLGAISEYPNTFEWHKSTAPMVPQSPNNNVVTAIAPAVS